jgi:hypothetical protein
MKPSNIEEKQSSSKPIPIKNTLKHKDDSSDDEYKTPNTPHFLNDNIIKMPQIIDTSKNVRFSLDKLSIEEDVPENLDNIILTKEDIFVNLTLIAKIEVGDKLIRNKDDKHLNIDTSYFQFITRWLKGNSRNTSLKFISLVLTKAFEVNDMLLADKSPISAQQLFRLTSDLKNCLNGLNNLKQTYSFDKLIQSEIDVMIDNIRSKLDFNSKNLHF